MSTELNTSGILFLSVHFKWETVFKNNHNVATVWDAIFHALHHYKKVAYSKHIFKTLNCQLFEESLLQITQVSPTELLLFHSHLPLIISARSGFYAGQD
jgi:hypothetical protein